MSKRNLEMIRGEREEFVFVLIIHTEGKPDVQGFFPGDIFDFTVRKNFDSPVVISRRIEEFTDEGKAVVEIYPEDTCDLDVGKYVYDGQFTRSDGYVRTVFGPAVFSILPEKENEP